MQATSKAVPIRWPSGWWKSTSAWAESLSYRKTVEKIIVENNRARGVVLTDGKFIPADYVISAADGYSTIYKMLDGKYISKEFDFAYKNWELFIPLVQVSFGINQAIKSDSPIVLNFTKGMSIGRTKLDYGYSVMNYSYDSTMAPEGKTTIVMRFESPWNLWQDLEGEEYNKEKEQIKKDATACLEKLYPGSQNTLRLWMWPHRKPMSAIRGLKTAPMKASCHHAKI